MRRCHLSFSRCADITVGLHIFLFSTNIFGKLDLSLKYFSLVFDGDKGKYQVSSLQYSSSLFRHFFVFFLNFFFVIPHLHGKCKDRYST